MSSAKRVVSVSLGSSRRDHRAELELAGERFVLERIGTDGSMDRAVQLIRELDGQVAAIGLGGIDLYLVAGGRRYLIRDAAKLAKAAQVTPVVDGSGLKNTLERQVVQELAGTLDLAHRRVLLVSAVDRFGMAEGLVEAGARVLFGDLIFSLGLPVPIYRLSTIRLLAALLLPVLTQLPFQWLYPTGSQQESSKADWRSRYYQWAEVIAGDFHFIRRHLPQDLGSKVMITNTVTSEDVELLRGRGLATLVTTTPELDGRSFGTNVIEALLVAKEGAPGPLKPERYQALIRELGLEGRVTNLAQEAAALPQAQPVKRGARGDL
ncbi:MAG: quinate 5-dehydrogenase [Deinococcus sp.]|nr:quinate 5-dehydrogenase [Deinococcus sp.]